MAAVGWRRPAVAGSQGGLASEHPPVDEELICRTATRLAHRGRRPQTTTARLAINRQHLVRKIHSGGFLGSFDVAKSAASRFAAVRDSMCTAIAQAADQWPNDENRVGISFTPCCMIATSLETPK
jgi:hypothetical protein